MKRFKKKESGAEGRKRRKLEAEEEARRSGKFSADLFETPGASGPASLFVREGGSSTNATRAREEPLNPVQGRREPEPIPADVGRGAGWDAGASRGNLARGPLDQCSGESDKYDFEGIKTDARSDVESIASGASEVIERRDIGLLAFDEDTGKAMVPDALRTEIIKLGSKYFQNAEGPFLPTNNRSMNKTWFRRKLANGRGAEVARSWLVYSPAKRSAFCICCLLYYRSDHHHSSLELEGGFNQWKAPERIGVHENARHHRECFVRWKETERGLAASGGGGGGVCDELLRPRAETPTPNRREFSARVVRCVKFIASENLALRGRGAENLLGLLRLLAAFDPVTAEHLARADSGPASESCVSTPALNEFVGAMAADVRSGLLGGVRRAKYYGLTFDSTAAWGARGRVFSQVARYADVDFGSKTVRLRESFLGFFRASSVEDIARRLDADGIDLRYCRSLRCDGDDLRRGLGEKFNLEAFANRDDGSLGSAAVLAAGRDPEMAAFFRTVEDLTAFFRRASPRLREKLRNAAPALTVDRDSGSEGDCSASAEAVGAVHGHVGAVLEALRETSGDAGESAAARGDAARLLSRALGLGFPTLLGFWNAALAGVERAQQGLRDPGASFRDAALALKSLGDYLDGGTEALVAESLDKGLALCRQRAVEFERPPVRTGDGSTDAGLLTAREELERVMRGTLGRLRRETDERFARLRDADDKFGFLLDAGQLCYGVDAAVGLRERCENLGRSYPSDVDASRLHEEILECRSLLSNREDAATVSRPEELLEFIVRCGADDSFLPNLRVAVQILLTVSVAGYESPLGKPRLIRSYLRACAGRDGPRWDLALLSVEREETEATDFDPERFPDTAGFCLRSAPAIATAHNNSNRRSPLNWW